MKTMLARLTAWLPRLDHAGLAGPHPLTTANMLSLEWLAPHLVRLPAVAAQPRRRQDV